MTDIQTLHKEGRMQILLCKNCNQPTEHRHLHDEAHGISGTHMSGTEHFVCVECGYTTYHKDDPTFPFQLDGKAA